MDPDANLEEQRRIARRLLADLDGCGNYASAQDRLADIARLCELVRGLDEWISGGGSYPRSWSNFTRAGRRG